MGAASIAEKMGLYVRTVSRMKPIMVASRLRWRRRVDIAALSPGPLKATGILIPETDLAPAYLERFDVEASLEGELLLLNERHRPDFSTWQVPEASHLWNFNLHYFEYCIPLAARWRRDRDECCLEKLKELIGSWMSACTYPEGDAWHPYTISLRLVNWLVCRDLVADALALDPLFDEAMRRSMYAQYRHLLANQETHLLANHYFENLKTLVIFSKLFDEEEAFSRVWRDFEAQLEEQILGDGVHFERSLMYHKLILEGLLRVARVMEGIDGSAPAIVAEKAKAMLDAMASLENGMGKTPFFNDAADGVAKECDQLVAACETVLGLHPDDSKTDFPDAGYYKLYEGDIAVMFDAGEPGPSYMLGHAHCDALSFELSYKGKPVIVNSGTYAYQSELRPYFRSTAAHNTAQVDGEEQLECWGEHRVGRGIKRVRVLGTRKNGVTASYEACDAVRHERSILLANEELQLCDSFDRVGDKLIVAYLHVAPGFTAEVENTALDDAGASYMVRIFSRDAEVLFYSKCELLASFESGFEERLHSSEFGRIEVGNCIKLTSLENYLSVRVVLPRHMEEA